MNGGRIDGTSCHRWIGSRFVNYDFRARAVIIPYATQEGEISFCAYNTAWAGEHY